MSQLLITFAISFLIGLLLGIERERSHPEGYQAIGVRTFTLFSILGTIAATLQKPLISFALCLFVFSIIIVSYLKSTSIHKKNLDIGVTTEVAAGIVFLLGYMLTIYPLVSITISAVILLVLMERQRIHDFTRKKIKSEEIEVLIILAIFVIGILPILPDRPIDPWGLFNPKNFAILIALIAGMQFFGYIAIRMFGDRLGRAISGFFGGLISSTAVFASLKQNLGSGQYARATMSSAIFATTAMIVEFTVIVFVASPKLLLSVVWPVVTMILVSSIMGFLLIYWQKKADGRGRQQKPLRLSILIYSAVLVALLLILIAFTKKYIGVEGIGVVTFLGGLFELHAVTLATTLLYLDHNITLLNASSALAMAMLAAFVSKFVLLALLTPKKFALQTSGLLFIVLSTGAVSYFLLNIY